MNAYRTILISSVATAALVFVPGFVPIVRAQEAQEDVANSKYQFTGEVNSNAVYVRSGASENDYPTLRLDKGAQVMVVGIKTDWLKITPPDGSFCYVAKAYVERNGDGSIGRVTNNLNVRIGSTLNPMKTKLAMKLDQGAQVSITGEQDEYFKIKPPQGTFLYVNKGFVEPVKAVAEVVPPAPAGVTPPNDNMPGNVAVAPQMPDPQTSAGMPTTGPVAANGKTEAPTTAPVAAADEKEFDRLESLYAESTNRPITEDTGVSELARGYAKAAAAPGLPESLRRIAEQKARALKARAEAREQYLAVKKMQDEADAKTQALRSERKELEHQIKTSDVQFFAAVGTLRPSSLQQGATTLWRLTDPQSGRTIVYLRSDDIKLGSFTGQFIGIKGEVQNDPQLALRVITPTAFEPVDPAKVNKGIAATIVPPSVMPSGQASTN